MAFNVKIKNVGKLNDAVVHIDRFTVLAGPNNSGKSFVSKIVYSIFNALRADPINQYFFHLINTLDVDSIVRLSSMSWFDDDPDDFAYSFRRLQSFITDSQFKKNNDVEGFLSELVERIDNVLKCAEEQQDFWDIEYSTTDHGEHEERLNYFLWGKFIEKLNTVKNEIKENRSDVMLEQGRSLELERNFIDNFQVSTVSQLGAEESEPFHVELENIGEIKFGNGKFNSKLRKDSARYLRGFSTVTYLESPIYLKLMRSLELLYSNFNFSHRKLISGVPGYFYDLVNTLKLEFVGDIAFPDLYEKLTSDEILGGRLTISDDGRISFQENGRRFNLSVTATGIANLGLLALLIERKALDKKSFLFIDEPEAHLHPSWQVFMAESLFELAKQGVHVVIATHSIEILKWLEVQIKKCPEDESFVALNQFPIIDSPLLDQSDSYDFETKLSDIKQNLAEPFTKLYIDGL